MSAVVALAPEQKPEPFSRRRVSATLLRAAGDLLGCGVVENRSAATVAMVAARDELARIGYIQDNREITRALNVLRSGVDNDFGAILVIIQTAQTLTKAEYLAENGPLVKSA